MLSKSVLWYLKIEFKWPWRGQVKLASVTLVSVSEK